MRRLTVLQLLPALGNGGVERSTLEIAAALVQAGHQSVVVSAGGRLVDRLQRAGSEHIELDIGRKSLSTLRHVVALRRIIRQYQPDIVHARSRLPAWLAWLALRGLDAPRPHLITTVHGLNSPGWYSSIMTRGERVICVSGSVRAHVLCHWPGTNPANLVVIERGIDAAHFCPSPEGRPAADGPKRLLMPGRGTRLKGHEAALNLLADLRAAGCDASLWLLGTREPGREAYIAEIEAVAAKLGVAHVIEISPPVHDVLSAYRQADLVLQLSAKPEAFGRTVVEALCTGAPVVGWNHGGVGELLGKYFPAGQVALGDRQALLATTIKVLAQPRPAPPIKLQSLEAMQAQTIKVYESLSA